MVGGGGRGGSGEEERGSAFVAGVEVETEGAGLAIGCGGCGFRGATPLV